MKQNATLIQIRAGDTLVAAIEKAQQITGANRSEITREAIELGLKSAVARRQRQSRESRALLAMPAK